jgi:hypothetical protein
MALLTETNEIDFYALAANGRRDLAKSRSKAGCGTCR